MLLEVAVSKSLEYNLVSLLGERYTGMSYERAMDSRTNMHKSGGLQERNGSRSRRQRGDEWPATCLIT
jgi:hypothetical protein